MLSDSNLIVAGPTSPMSLLPTTAGIPNSVTSAASIDRQANQDFGAGSKMSLVFNTEILVVPRVINSSVILPAGSNGFGLSNNGLNTGTPVILQTTVADPVLGPVKGGTTYYAIRLDISNMSLATTYANSFGPTPITTSAGTLGITSLTTLDFQIITAEDAALTKSVRVAGSSGPIPVNVPRQVGITNGVVDMVLTLADQYETGTAIVFTFTGTITPLISGAVYYVTLPTTTGFKVATSYVNALAGIFIDIGAPSVSTAITVKVADNMLVPGGPQIFVDFNPRVMGPNVGQQYIGARIVPSTTLSSGSFTAKFAMNVDSAVGGRGVRAYTSGYTI